MAHDSWVKLGGSWTMWTVQTESGPKTHTTGALK